MLYLHKGMQQTCRKPPTPPEWMEASRPALELPEDDPERLKNEVKLPALPAKKLLQNDISLPNFYKVFSSLKGGWSIFKDLTVTSEERQI